MNKTEAEIRAATSSQKLTAIYTRVRSYGIPLRSKQRYGRAIDKRRAELRTPAAA